MQLSDMQVGHCYLVGDGGGYDRVKCLEINPSDHPASKDCFVVKIQYLESDIVDYFFEHTSSMDFLFVQEI
jgi:hypothetical protein